MALPKWVNEFYEEASLGGSHEERRVDEEVLLGYAAAKIAERLRSRTPTPGRSRTQTPRRASDR